jgi:hypothetical protein
MTSALDYREYENGVADVLRFVAGDGAEVRQRTPQGFPYWLPGR